MRPAQSPPGPRAARRIVILLGIWLAVFFSEVGPSPLAFAAPLPPPAPSATPPADGGVDEQTEFEKARNAYRAQKYDEADARFLRMLDPQHGTLHDKVLIKQARMYWAATLIAEHHDEDATSLFETILTEDRDYEPDPLAFPTDVVNAFIDTRAQLREKLAAIAREQYRRAAERRAKEEAARVAEAARIKMLEKMAGEVEVTEKHSRWVGLIPFGVGQFQNGQRKLGWFFLVLEGTLTAGGLITVPIYYVDLANANDTYSPQTSSVAQQYLDRANAARYVNLSLYGALVTTAVIGAIQAEVAYVPDPVRIEPRALPPTSATSKGVGAQASTPLPFTLGGTALPGRDGRGFAGGALTVGVAF